MLKIGNKPIGREYLPYLIAEIGLNHNGNFITARALIREAAKAGADAVKFQTFDHNKLYVGGNNKFKNLQFTQEQFTDLKAIADEAGVHFLSTAFDIESLEFLVNLGVPAMKIASGDSNYGELQVAAMMTGLPMLVSTGMVLDHELPPGAGETIVFMHCVSLYPVPDQYANLTRVLRMPSQVAGYSDHCIGNEACIAAVALGACVIEKHFTMKHNQRGDDHVLSATPDELKAMRVSINRVHAMVQGSRGISQMELNQRGPMRRGVYATKDILPGGLLTKENTAALRPWNHKDGQCQPSDLYGRSWKLHEKLGVQKGAEIYFDCIEEACPDEIPEPEAPEFQVIDNTEDVPDEHALL